MVIYASCQFDCRENRRTEGSDLANQSVAGYNFVNWLNLKFSNDVPYTNVVMNGQEFFLRWK